jgi:hypothetical protein
MNYFSIENQWNRFTVYRPGPQRSGPRDFIKRWPSAQRSTTQIKNVKGFALDLILAVDQGRDGSRHLRPATAATWHTERRCHGPYSGEAARGLWLAFLDVVYPYGGGVGRRTLLRGSWAAPVTRAVRVMVAGLLRSSTMVGAHSGCSPMTRSSPTAPLRPPLASPRLQLRRAAVEDGGG